MDLLDRYLSLAVSDWRVWIVGGLLIVGGLFVSFRFSQERLLWDSLSDMFRGRSAWPVLTLILLLLLLLSFIGLRILT